MSIAATLKFRYPEYDDDMTADEVDAIVLNAYKKNLEDFLRFHPVLNKVSYIGVCTGYTDRIMRKQNAVEKLRPSMSVIYGDRFTEPSDVLVIVDPNVYNLTKDIDQCRNMGTVIFEDSDPMHVFDYVTRLGDIKYCAFCQVSCIMSMNWYELSNGTTIMVCEVDTESG